MNWSSILVSQSLGQNDKLYLRHYERSSPKGKHHRRVARLVKMRGVDVPTAGQRWTTLEELGQCSHRNWQRRSYEQGLFGIGTVPDFAIDQRALLLCTSEGNFLWDCVSLVDDATIALVKSLGGLRGIAISHPHYYSTMVEWSRAFGGVPIHLHAADRAWVMRQDEAVRFWEGEEQELASDVTLIRCGGHFPGGTVLHWCDGADGCGALPSAEMFSHVMPDVNARASCLVIQMPSCFPASAVESDRAKDGESLSFDRIYGAFWERVVWAQGASLLRATPLLATNCRDRLAEPSRHAALSLRRAVPCLAKRT